MADHLAVLNQTKTSYNLGKKAFFSEIHQLRTFGVQHRLGRYVQFVAHTSLAGPRVVAYTYRQINRLP